MFYKDALRQTACGKIFKDVIAGSTTERAGLLEVLRSGGLHYWIVTNLARTPELTDTQPF